MTFIEYAMSEESQYVQLAIKLNGRIVAILLTADPKSYVMFVGVTLLITEIGSTAVKQVSAGNNGSLHGS